MSFDENEQRGLQTLTNKFPGARYHQITDHFQQNALFLFQQDWRELDKIKLHLNATSFQLKVWESLLTVPRGSLATYGDIAQKIGKPKAARAVGTAIGSNPVAFLIPCHRVIQSSGHLGGYMWGATRKSAMIGWEASQVNS